MFGLCGGVCVYVCSVLRVCVLCLHSNVCYVYIQVCGMYVSFNSVMCDSGHLMCLCVFTIIWLECMGDMVSGMGMCVCSLNFEWCCVCVLTGSGWWCP